MNRHLFSDTATHDTMFKKVFFRHRTAFLRRWCAVTAPLLYIIYIYCHKSHKCHCPLFSRVSAVTLVFTIVSCVTVFPILGTASRGLLSSVLCPRLATLYAGACL